MRVLDTCKSDRIVFDSDLVRIGAFRCHPDNPSFRDSGPARTCCFVFPRTAVEIQHEHERAFVANPNVVTFYNQGQSYLRDAVSAEGDRCDWFGVQLDVVQDVVRNFDPKVESHPERPFRFTRTWSQASTYLAQRQLFEQIVAGTIKDPLTIEETVVCLLADVVQTAYEQRVPEKLANSPARQRDVVHHVEFVFSQALGESLSLRQLAGEVGLSIFHLCRLFRCATGSTLHQYRQKLRVRASLEDVMESGRPLVDIALDAGFSSHSHYTSSFRREFSRTPSRVREATRAQDFSSESNILIARTLEIA